MQTDIGQARKGFVKHDIVQAFLGCFCKMLNRKRHYLSSLVKQNNALGCRATQFEKHCNRKC